jgi:hypothetical protein
MGYVQLTAIQMIAFYELEMAEQEAAMLSFKLLRPWQ